MSKDVKGVFVRLPLSEEQINELYHTVMYCGEEAALLAIGIPVAGGKLESVYSIDEDILRDIRELGDDDEEYVTDMVFKPGYDGTTPLVRQSDALAKLAEKDAKIARLRDVLSLFTAYESLMDDGEDVAAMAAYANLQLKVHEALKGPEA